MTPNFANDPLRWHRERQMLETLSAMLELASTTFVEVCAHDDKELMERGEYTAAEAFANTLFVQVEGLQNTVRQYHEYLKVKRSKERQQSITNELSNPIPF